MTNYLHIFQYLCPLESSGFFFFFSGGYADLCGRWNFLVMLQWLFNFCDMWGEFSNIPPPEPMFLIDAEWGRKVVLWHFLHEIFWKKLMQIGFKVDSKQKLTEWEISHFKDVFLPASTCNKIHFNYWWCKILSCLRMQILKGSV